MTRIVLFMFQNELIEVNQYSKWLVSFLINAIYVLYIDNNFALNIALKIYKSIKVYITSYVKLKMLASTEKRIQTRKH